MSRIVPYCLVISLFLMSCIDQPTPEPIGNVPPTTYVWLMPDDTLRTTTSRQHIHWWGDDPDGFVVGYEWSFDAARWNWTERTDSVFLLSLQREDTTYTFYVRAVDNDGARDPEPASISLPIRNSPPSVEFVMGSEVPESTFTVATFTWVGTDPDGDDTIQRYFWALNDTTEWNELPGGTSMLTVREADGLRVNDTNVFYLKAQDIAGAMSTTAWMPGNPAPDNPDRPPDPNAFWYVREPVGDILFVNDYPGTEGLQALEYYRSILDTLDGGRLSENSQLNIRRGRTGDRRGDLVPALINPTFVETLRLFRVVFWFSDDRPSYNVAESAIPRFIETGGRVLFSATFPPVDFDPREMGLLDFAPIDSIGATVGWISTNTPINPTQPALTLGYPQLYRDSTPTSVGGVRRLYPEIGAVPLYNLQTSGEPLIGVKSADNSLVFMGFRLHRIDGNPNQPETRNLGRFLRKVLIDEFNL